MHRLTTAAIIGTLTAGLFAQQASQPQQQTGTPAGVLPPAQTGAPQVGGTASHDPVQQPGAFTLSVDTNIVLTNVIVRDKKTGAVVKGLTPADFQIYEDKKQQKIASFDYQNVDDAVALAEKNTVSGKATIADLLNRNLAASPKDLRDHRLIVMFFDITSMQDEDTDRAVQSAVKTT